MLHRNYWIFVSVGSLSTGFISLAMLHAAGCGQDPDALYDALGRCASPLSDGNPCTRDWCTGSVNMHDPVADGTACTLGKNQGMCENGLCNLACMSMPSSCVCGTAEDCPTATECMGWRCENYRCNADPHTDMVVAAQVMNDCKKVTCTADGIAAAQNDDSDLPLSNGPCFSGICKDGIPDQTPLPADHACSNGQTGICNDLGECVRCKVGTPIGCNANKICEMSPTGDLRCTTCSNGIKDGDETDTDCGGSCAECPGGPCNYPNDCKNGNCVDNVCCENACTKMCKICGTNGKCTDLPAGEIDLYPQPLCPDSSGGRACNGQEACIDKSANGEPCEHPWDCASNNCTGNPPSCTKNP